MGTTQDNTSFNINELAGDTSLISTTEYEFFIKADSSQQIDILKSAISCVFVRPLGTGKNPVFTGKRPTNKEWSRFCVTVTDIISRYRKDMFNQLSEQSPLMHEYKCLWPQCSAQITQSILNMRGQLEKQKEVRVILRNTLYPTSNNQSTTNVASNPAATNFSGHSSQALNTKTGGFSAKMNNPDFQASSVPQQIPAINQQFQKSYPPVMRQPVITQQNIPPVTPQQTNQLQQIYQQQPDSLDPNVGGNISINSRLGKTGQSQRTSTTNQTQQQNQISARTYNQPGGQRPNPILDEWNTKISLVSILEKLV